MNNLGICYELGHGVDQDEMMSAKLYEEAALLGNPNAMANIAFVLLKRSQYKKARRWFWRAIDSTESNSKTNVFGVDSINCSTPCNIAVSSVNASSNGENAAAAHYHLACMYERGLGGNVCENSARFHFEEAAKHRHPYAMLKLADIILESQQHDPLSEPAKQAFQLYK